MSKEEFPFYNLLQITENHTRVGLIFSLNANTFSSDEKKLFKQNVVEIDLQATQSMTNHLSKAERQYLLNNYKWFVFGELSKEQ